MKRLNFVALLLGATLFLGFGASTLSAQSMSCCASKCGCSMKAPVKACGDENCGTSKDCKCGTNCKCNSNSSKCESGACK